MYKYFLMANIDLDSTDKNYRKLIIINVIFIISVIIYPVFIFANIFEEKYLVASIISILTATTLYGFFNIRKNKNIEFSAIFTTILVFIAPIVILVVHRGEGFSILWTFVVPSFTMTLIGSKKGLYYIAVFYTIIFVYAYQLVGDTILIFDYKRYIAVSISIFIIAYYYELATTNALNMLMESNKKILSLNNNLKEQGIKLKEEQDLLSEIINASSNIIFITDFKNIKHRNNSFNSLLFSQNSNTILDAFLESDKYIHKGLLKKDENFQELITRTQEKDRIVSILDINYLPKIFTISITKLMNNEDYLISLTDITKMQEHHIQTEKKVYIDGLTGVYNRNKFDEIFEKEYNKVRRYNEPLSVAIIDIDKFKDFNDNYGHLIGDEVLTSMAQTVNNAIRNTDIFARWGGEEFVILFSNTTLDIAKEVSLKLKDKIEDSTHPTAGKITASFGITEYKEGDTIESIFKRCDEALYLAKENGRNKVEIL